MTTKINTSQIADGAITAAKINSSVQLGGPTITAIAYPGDDTAADTAGGQTITLTGTGFKTGASVIINGTTASVVTFISNTSITFTAPAQSAGSYVLYLVNTDGGTAIAVPGIQYSGTPTWSTAAGSLATYTETVAISNTVTATGDAPITYSLYSGSLPSGATLNTSSGLISGSSPLANNATTYNFTIRATDLQKQDTDRAFSITINPDVVTWNSPANGTTYSVATNSPISNVALSATAASGQTITYTANSLPTGVTLSGNTISGTPTVAATVNTLLTATSNNTNKSAIQIINWVVSVAADTYFPRVGLLLSGNTPANTFVSDASTNNFAVTINGDTRPNNLNPYTAGYYSNYFDGTGDYLLVASNAAFGYGSGDFTIEMWYYFTGTTSDTRYFFNQRPADGTALAPCILLNAGVITVFLNGVYAITGPTVTVNNWNHLALVRASGTTKLYINGTQSGSNYTDSNVYITSPMYIGATVSGYSWLGYISNFRVVKGTAVYTSAFTPPTSPLSAIANTSLLTCQSNRFIDNSTNNFTITINGDTIISGFEPFTPNSSYSTYGSGYFDGTGDYLTTPTSTGFGFGTGTFTFEAWTYPTSNPTNGPGTIIDCRSGTNAEGWVVRIFNDLTVGLYDGPSNAYVYSTGTVKLNAWNHIAIVRSSTSSGGVAFYINGVAAGTATVSSNLGTTWVAMVGNNYSAGYAYYGYMTDVRVVKGSTVYTTAFTPTTSPLTAVSGTSLLTLQNNQPNNNSTFVDNSTNNFLVTRAGNATQGSFSPYAGTWSNYFDGTGDYLTAASSSGLGFGTGDFTIELWAYAVSFPNTYSAIFDLTQYTTGILLRYQSTSDSLYIAGTAYNWTPTTNFPLNQWNHIALTRSSGAVKLFINGTSVLSVTNTADLGSSNNMRIGDSQHATGSTWIGYVSNFRAIKGTALYTSTFTPPTAPLTTVSGTGLLTCQSNRIVDNSPYNLSITRNGDVAVQKFSPFSIQTAIVPTSYSAYFDGTGDYLSVADNDLLDAFSSDFTIEFWVYLSVTSGTQAILSKGWDSGANFSPYLFLISSGNLIFYASSSGGSWDLASGTTIISSISANTWYHVAVSRSGSSLKIFANGSVINTITTSSIFMNSGSACTIGAAGGGYSPMTGYVSNVRIVKGTAIYTSAFTSPTTPLSAVSNTSLLTCQSTTFIDNSTNAFTITANGDSKPTIQNPFGYTNPSAAAYTTSSLGGSMYLDGSGDYVYGSVASPGTGDYSIEAWVYFTGTPKGVVQLTTSLAPSSYSGIGFGIEPNTSYFSYFHGGYTTPNSPYYTALQNTWYHLAQTRQSGTIRFFINGILVSSVSDTTNYTGNYYCKLGGVYDNTFLMTGYMSDFRYVLGQALYTSSFVPPAAPLTAIKNSVFLLNGTGAGIYDSSLNNDIETFGTARSLTTLKKYGNASVYFDGSSSYLTAPINSTLQLGTGDFTIEFWSYLTSRAQSYPAIFSNYNSFTGGSLALFAGHGSGTTTAYQVAINGSFPAIQGGTISYNTWVHLAVVRSGSTVTLYVGGTSVGTATSSASLNGVGSLFYIGTTGDSIAGGCIQGYLSDFRISKGYARYTGNFTPPTTAFIAK